MTHDSELLGDISSAAVPPSVASEEVELETEAAAASKEVSLRFLLLFLRFFFFFPPSWRKSYSKIRFSGKRRKKTYVFHGVHGYALCREVVREERVLCDPILLAAHHKVDLAGVLQLAVLGSVVVPKLFGKTACFFMHKQVLFIVFSLLPPPGLCAPPACWGPP